MQNNAVTINDVLLGISKSWMDISLVMTGLTLFSLLICFLLLKSERIQTAYQFMSFPVVLTTIPGIFFTLILAYLLFYTGKDMLSLPVFYFIPPVWMVASLYLYSQLVDFEKVPGFDTIKGLAFFSALSFVAVLVLFRLKIIAIGWFRPVWIVGIVVLFYVLYRYAWKKMLKRKKGYSQEGE
ncbi:hypothetical protein JW935_04005 [candidate division KSB1 bacterium]|nr:hypothetical protein [candidate division KSB1 bacterium]